MSLNGRITLRYGILHLLFFATQLPLYTTTNMFSTKRFYSFAEARKLTVESSDDSDESDNNSNAEPEYDSGQESAPAEHSTDAPATFTSKNGEIIWMTQPV